MGLGRDDPTLIHTLRIHRTHPSTHAHPTHQVRHHCPGVPCIIVGTQMDLREEPSTVERLAKNRQKPISSEAGERLGREMGAVKYLECSALTQKGLKNVFDEAIIAALEPPPSKKGKKCSIL